MNSAAIGLLIIFWAMTIVVLRMTPIIPRKSLSWHIAQTKRGIMYGEVGLTIAGVLLAISLFGYIIPKYALGFWSTILSVSIIGSGLLTAYLPYNVSPRQNWWHDRLIIVYVILNPILLLIIYSVLAPGWLKNMYLAGIVAQVDLIVILAVTKPGKRDFFLSGQLLFMSIFAVLLAFS